jgi:hypothetical protein
MNKLLAGLLAAWLGFGPAFAANVNIDGLPAASGVNSTDLLECEQSGANNKCTAAQLQTFVSPVSSVSGSCGITVSPTTGATVASGTVTARNNTATTDTLVTGDCGTVVTESNASPVAVAIAQAGTTGFASGYYVTVKNKGAGLVTITPTTSTIDGNATLTLKQNQSVDLYSDGANYQTLPGRPTNAACADLTNAGALCSTTPGTGVAAAAANNLSSAGGLSSTIASGTAALGTTLIASGACGSATTVSATNVATTDAIRVGFNGDPTGTTGYLPTAMLTIVPYPTSGNVNFKQCNLTGSSITPSALTINWWVVR